MDITHWHGRSTRQVLAALQTTERGLDEAEARTRLVSHGPNRLPAPPHRGWLPRFLAQFRNILIYVLLGSALITLLLQHLLDTLVILAVVLVNALIGMIQEGKAEKAMDAIREMLAPYAAVLRDGQRQTLAAEQLVPGDIVLLEAGDRVPADLRLLRTRNLQIQEAILTGESLPVDKRTEPVAEALALGDRTCMAFSGTLVSSGQGRGVVVATGTATEIGRISGLLSAVQTLTTPLVRQLEVFARWLTLVILGGAALILGFGLAAWQQPFQELFMAVVGLSVAAIPEGLPAVLTITLAVGVQAMAARNAIVRRLPAIETLGSVSVICTDKTGTLTRNEMSVVAALCGYQRFEIDGVGYAPSGEVRRAGRPVTPHEVPRLRELARAGALCNDAGLREQDSAWRVAGDPMEGALLALAGKLGFDHATLESTWARTDGIPFDATQRFMATLHHDHQNHAFILVKGAPERLLTLCEAQRDGVDGTAPLAADHWHGEAERLAAAGQRVLALAAKPVAPEHTVLELADLDQGLVLLGLVGLIDPPRPEAMQAVAACQSAGIQVKMITGDHAGTAMAIGRAIGLRHPDRLLTGAQLDAMDDTALTARVLDTDIFARTSPEHKLRLVMALQARNMTVAMTGDGVNDAPALKRADAGIAMGGKGSEAAREAAEIVLADDNFASIVAAVHEGRAVYDNIKKVIGWTLPTNAGEAMTIVVALLLGMSLPVTPVQILWVNLITAVTLGIALAFEPASAHLMARPPRDRAEPLLSGQWIWHIVLVALLILAGVYGMYAHAVATGYEPALARTLAMNTLVMMEIGHLFFIRHGHAGRLCWQSLRGTRILWSLVGVVVVAQLAITYIPPLQAIFDTRAVSAVDNLWILAIGFALWVVVELERRLRDRLAGLAIFGDVRAWIRRHRVDS